MDPNEGGRPDRVEATHRRGLATLPWRELGFDFTPTRSMVRYNYKDGVWDDGAIEKELKLEIHPLSNALHAD